MSFRCLDLVSPFAKVTHWFATLKKWEGQNDCVTLAEPPTLPETKPIFTSYVSFREGTSFLPYSSFSGTCGDGVYFFTFIAFTNFTSDISFDKRDQFETYHSYIILNQLFNFLKYYDKWMIIFELYFIYGHSYHQGLIHVFLAPSNFNSLHRIAYISSCRTPIHSKILCMFCVVGCF